MFLQASSAYARARRIGAQRRSANLVGSKSINVVQLQHQRQHLLHPTLATRQQKPAELHDLKQQCTFSQQHWDEHAQDLLQRLELSPQTTPQQLWQHLSCKQQNAESQKHHQHVQQLQQALDLQSCRLLVRTAATTCNSQHQLNQLHGLIDASTAVFPEFDLTDFRQLLQLCAQARYIPDKEWLAAIIYADTGGFERLYMQETPADIVALFSDLSAMLCSHRQLFLDTQQHMLLHQQAVQSDTAGSTGAADLAALQAALQKSTANLGGIQQDSLLAGELSAVGGYWLLRRLLPQLQGSTSVVLQGLAALQGLNYQVLDADDADLLLQHVVQLLPRVNCNELATTLATCLPCLGDTAPSNGDSLAVLFAAAGAAAGGMASTEAGQVLVALSRLPGYAPDPQVAQALLDQSLQPPSTCTAPQLYQLLTAATELGAAPRPRHLEHIQRVLSSVKSQEQ